MSNINNQINDFKEKIKVKYPELYIGYSYNADEDYYHIWHTNSHLQFEDDDFLKLIGGLIRECFYSKDIYNFSFGYDYLEDEKSKLIYEVKRKYNDITLNIGQMVGTQQPIHYHLIKNYTSLNWANFDSIKIDFDAKDLSFCNQLIRQVPLVSQVVECDNQPNKGLAA